MRYSFLFVRGRMSVNGETIEGDGRLYHLDLPRGAGLADEVHGVVAGEPVAIPAIDVLNAIRHLGGEAVWLESGARAHLTAANPQPHGRQVARAFLTLAQASIDRGDLSDDIEPPRYREGRNVRYRWQAIAPELTKPPAFDNREEAEAWSAHRAFGRRIGWPYIRVTQLFTDPDAFLTFDELLGIADYFGEPPSATLERTKEVAA